MTPSLDPAERRQLLGPRGQCDSCGAPRVKHYCRSCDEFFDTCGCAAVRLDALTHFEKTHRLYLWTPMGIVAIPNFDELLS